MVNRKIFWPLMIYSICLLSVIPIISATGMPAKITGKYWRNSTQAFEAITDFLTSEELGLGLLEFSWHFKDSSKNS